MKAAICQRNRRMILRHQPPAQQGFTLIELLVVIAITIIIFGLSIASYTSFNRKERLQQAALNFKSDLRYAQTRAISAEKPSSGCTTFLGMRITFTDDTYTIQHECTEGAVGTAETVTLPRGITFSSVPAAFTFMVLTRRSSLTTDQTATLTNATQSYAIQIATSGDVNDLGFQ